MPSLREKKRYLAFEIISERQISEFLPVSEAICDALYEFLGTLGYAHSGALLLEEAWQPATQNCVIKVNNKYVEKLKTCLALVEGIGQQNVIVKSVKVSGNLKKAKSFAAAS